MKKILILCFTLKLLVLNFNVLADSKHHHTSTIIINAPTQEPKTSVYHPVSSTIEGSATNITNYSTSTAGIASAMAAAGDRKRVV